MLTIAITLCLYTTAEALSDEINRESEAPTFVLRAARTLTIGRNATVSGGAIAAQQVVISGGRIESIFAPTVRLKSAVVRGDIFADELTARNSEYRRLAPFEPDTLGALNPRPSVAPGDGKLLVRSGRKVVLAASTGPVHVQKGGTLVIKGGFYELASLTLNAKASVIVYKPTRLTIRDRLVLGPDAYIGPPPDSNVMLNLQILVAGKETRGSGTVEIGPGATIAADLLAPAGSIVMRRNANVYGRFEAQDIGVAAGVNATGMGIAPFSPCEMYTCWGQAVAGGSIDIKCGWVPMSPNIDNWLNSHAAIRDAIKWQFQTSGSPYEPTPQDFIAYTNWTYAEKAELKQSFDAYWLGYCKGEPLKGDVGLADPPVNVAQNINDDYNNAHTIISEQDMRSLLLADIGHSLALELGDYVPWSVLGDDAQSLEIYFSSLGHGRRMFYTSDFTVGESGPITYITNWHISYGRATPSPPAWTFNFLMSNGLIGNTRHDTIVNLLNWSRANMVHFYGLHWFKFTEDIWQYRGHPPVSRVALGTIDPQHGFEHWTAGCHGTAGWYRAVLRTANIPVQIPLVCNEHAQIYFRSEGLYLDHGDNPYTGYANALWPPEEALIDEATYIDWFGPNLDNKTTGCDNVGRRPQELNQLYNP
jgi:hypothetical protein